MTTALRCVDLRKAFGHVRAVDGVSFEIPEGSIFALLGPSGCGKTTVLRLIAGLEQPDRGRVEIGGEIASGDDVFMPAERRRVGLVFQDYALFPHLDVRHNVGFGLTTATERDSRVTELLKHVGLSGYGRRMPDELSGGQQQRVALARALAPAPRIVLLDEPFSNLDATLRVELRAEVRRILREVSATAVFVTHDQEEALSIADVVGVMFEGLLSQIGAPTDVYQRPATREVAEFVGEVNVFPGQGMGKAVVFELGTAIVDSPIVGHVDVLVRPEALVLSHDVQGAGTISKRQFFGHDQVIHVTLDSGQPVRCRVASGFVLADGARVRVQVDGHVMAFARGARKLAALGTGKLH